MFLSTIICAMSRRYLKLFKQKHSYYISWNILFLWGFGLWIALCTSNMYHSVISEQQAMLFYLYNLDFVIAYNISIQTETVENTLHISRKNDVFCNMILILKTVFQYMYVFVSISFVILFLCSHKCEKRMITVWNNMMCSIYSIVSYVTTLIRSSTKIIFLNKNNSNKNYSTILKSKLIANSEVNTKYFQKTLSYGAEEVKWTLNIKNKNMSDTRINNVQNEIIFSSYTLLIFNNCELYQYFINEQFKNHLLTKYFVCQNPEYIKSNLETSNNYKKNNFLSEKVMQKGIVSSSPEFKKFLINLKKSQFFYPCMLQVSASYMIRIKTIYK